MQRSVSTVLGALTAVTLLAGPVLAQPYGGPPQDRGAQHYDQGHGYGVQPGGWEINRRMRWLQERISRGRANGSLDRGEFRRVQMELNRIRHDDDAARAANHGHVPPAVRADLESRLDRLSDQIHWLRNNTERRPW
jgi:hypothetical protein